jgi:hypothetical protein|tara:strand:- start:702 stop:1019 length:318 start_codon:yes stop_codon:yes gene_type:complete
MSNLTMEYILIAFLGMFIHILIHILNRKNKSIPLSFSYYITDIDNWIRMILSTSSIFALLIMSESLSNMLGITLSNGASAKDVFAFVTGYLNHSLIKNVLRILKK